MGRTQDQVRAKIGGTGNPGEKTFEVKKGTLRVATSACEAHPAASLRVTDTVRRLLIQQWGQMVRKPRRKRLNSGLED